MRMDRNTAVLISEKDFLHTVVEMAQLYRWAVHHVFDTQHYARRVGVGFPDLVLAQQGAVIVVELKTETGRVTTEQKTWLGLFRSAGVPAFVWRPSQLDAIEALLRDQKATNPFGNL